MRCERRTKVLDPARTAVPHAAATPRSVAPPHSRRVLRTMLVTDLVGSTEQAWAVGDQRWADTMEDHDALVRQQLTAFCGVEVHTTGDGVLALFDGPWQAIACARAIAAGVHALGQRARAGIHTGEIERRGVDVAGLAVHISSRVADLARADEVLVSSVVPQLVLGSDLSFRDRGEHVLRGVPGRWRLYAVA